MKKEKKRRSRKAQAKTAVAPSNLTWEVGTARPSRIGIAKAKDAAETFDRGWLSSTVDLKHNKDHS